MEESKTVNANNDTYMTVSLHYDKEKGRIIGTVIPTIIKTDINEIWIKEELRKLKFDKYFILTEGICQTIEMVKEKKEGRVDIAQEVDAQIELNVSQDTMQVSATTKPAHAGKTLTKNQVLESLKELDITNGILENEIAMLCTEYEVVDQVIAQGCKAQKGIDAHFESLVKEVSVKELKADTTGKVNLYDVAHDYIVLDKGTELMRRIPATEGTNGYTVYGEVLEAVPGEEKSFAELDGANISTENSNMLIASIKGHPTVHEAGVSIEPTLSVKNVDLATGSIEFDGTLLVEGDIADNMCVNVTGDVIVKGVIQKAKVRAGENVRVNNGIIGGARRKEDENEVYTRPCYGAEVEAAGIITARFVDNAILKAGKTIDVKEYLRHCHTQANDSITLGQKGGKGQIIGGITVATKKVLANILGSVGDVKTRVEVGVDLALKAKYDELIDELDENKKTLKSANELLTHYKAELESGKVKKTSDIKSKIVQTISLRKETQQTISTLLEARETLESSMCDIVGARVGVSKQAYPMVYVKIQDAELKLTELSRQGSFVRVGRRVKFEGKSL